MKKIAGIISIAIALYSCGDPARSSKEAPYLRIANHATTVSVTVENSSNKQAELWFNDQKTGAPDASGAITVGEVYLRPGMNYLKLVSGQDTITDSVFFS